MPIVTRINKLTTAFTVDYNIFHGNNEVDNPIDHGLHESLLALILGNPSQMST